jgi:hypothetical protein
VLGAEEEIEHGMKSRHREKRSQGQGKSVMSHLPKESDEVNPQSDLRSHQIHTSVVHDGGR